MSWLSRLFSSSKPEQSAALAKERLQVIVAHQRSTTRNPEFFARLQQEIMNVIAKYVEVDLNQVKVALEQQGDRSILELNVSLPDLEMKFKTPEKACSTEKSCSSNWHSEKTEKSEAKEESTTA